MSDMKHYFEFERIFEHELFGKAITDEQMTKIADLFYSFLKEYGLFNVFKGLKYKELFRNGKKISSWIEDEHGYKLTHTDISLLKYRFIFR